MPAEQVGILRDNYLWKVSRSSASRNKTNLHRSKDNWLHLIVELLIILIIINISNQVLLRRGQTKDSEYMHVPTGCYDRDLFAIVWGPTVAALSFVFDRSNDDAIIQKAINGFRSENELFIRYL